MGKMTDALRKAKLLKEGKLEHTVSPPTEVERPVSPPAAQQRKPREKEAEVVKPPPKTRKPDAVAWTLESPAASTGPSAAAATEAPPVREMPPVLPEVEPGIEPAVEAPQPGTILPPVEPTPVETHEPYLSVHYCKDDQTAEEFRSLKNRLTSKGAPAKMIFVTSCRPGEGKTTVAVNLAVSFANTYGERVVLVDANVFRPKVAEVLGISNGGLGPVVRGHLAQEEAAVKTEIPGLWAVPLGDVGERREGLLDSKPVVAFLNGLRRRFSRVIVELPPVDEAPDALGLLSQADAVLVPVMKSRTRRGRLRRLLKKLTSHAGDKVHCVFLNV